MIITLVADVYGQQNNGTSITASRLVENLKQRGHEVRVVSTYESDDPHYYSVNRRNFGPLDYYIRVKNGVILGKPDKDKIWAAIKGADVVHFLLPFKMSKCGVDMCIEHGIPFTTAFHCPPEMISMQLRLLHFKPLNKMLYKYYYRFYKKAKYVHCPSKMVSDKLEKNGYKTKNYIISNGVSTVFFENNKLQVKANIDESKFNILSVGRLSPEKDHATIIKAVKLSKHEKDIQLIFAGQGPLKDKLLHQSEKSPALTNPLIVSLYSQPDLIALEKTCDLYIHAAKIEIEGMGCMEAISSGLVPVLSNSKDAAVSQFALTENNLFDCGDPQSLADKIDYWFEHQEARHEMKEKYISFMEEYNINKCIDKMLEMFNEAIEDNNRQKQAKALLCSDKIESIKKAITDKSTSLMIVAHPDDETFWGGTELINGKYFVLCITNGYNKKRSADFEAIIKSTNNQGLILDFKDTILRCKFMKQKDLIIEVLRAAICAKDWEKIVTHNPNGEYGHFHHKNISKWVSDLVKDKSKLYYFIKPKARLKKPEHTIDEASKKQLIKNYRKSQFIASYWFGYTYKINDIISYDDWYKKTK